MQALERTRSEHVVGLNNIDFIANAIHAKNQKASRRCKMCIFPQMLLDSEFTSYQTKLSKGPTWRLSRPRCFYLSQVPLMSWHLWSSHSNSICASRVEDLKAVVNRGQG